MKKNILLLVALCNLGASALGTWPWSVTGSSKSERNARRRSGKKVDYWSPIPPRKFTEEEKRQARELDIAAGVRRREAKEYRRNFHPKKGYCLGFGLHSKFLAEALCRSRKKEK